MMREMTSSNIAVNCAAVLSDCVFFAEVADNGQKQIGSFAISLRKPLDGITGRGFSGVAPLRTERAG
jgi:hypothetical protein